MSILHSDISKIDDPDFNQMIDEIYHCVDWRRDDQLFRTPWCLLGGIGAQDPKALSPSHLPTDGVLTTRIGQLPDGIVYDLCLEAAHLKRTHLDDEKTVLSLLKLILPKRARARKPTRGHNRHDASTRLIKQRRANGDL